MVESAQGKVKENCSNISKIWEDLTAALRGRGMDGSSVDSHVNVAKSFWNETPSVPLKDRSPADVDRFLKSRLENPGIQPRYVRLAVDSLQILFRDVLKTPWAYGYDWARMVAASTQNQALNALVFFFEKAVGAPLGDIGEFARAKRPKHIPVVLSRDEGGRLLAALSGVYRLMAQILYGSGLRLMECVSLRADR